MAKIEMRDDRHLDIWLDHIPEDPREVIIDSGDNFFPGDVRITDHKSVAKVMFNISKEIQMILVDDIAIWRRDKLPQQVELMLMLEEEAAKFFGDGWDFEKFLANVQARLRK